MKFLRVPAGTMTSAETVERYLPANYEVTASVGGYHYIKGYDEAGWTADDYVIPRLASGLIYAEKINEAEFIAATRPNE